MKRLPQIVTILFLGGAMWLAIGPDGDQAQRRERVLSHERPFDTARIYDAFERSSFLNRSQLQKTVPATRFPEPVHRPLRR